MPPAVGYAIAGIASGIGAIAGSRSASSASKRATEAEERGLDQQLALERERDVESRRQWDADQVFQQREFEAAEEARMFQRRLDTYNQELVAAREARRTPYRAASRAAMGRLGDVLGLEFDIGDAVASPGWETGDAGVAPTGAASDVVATGASRLQPGAPRTMGQVLGMDPAQAQTRTGDATGLSYSPVNQVRQMRRPRVRRVA